MPSKFEVIRDVEINTNPLIVFNQVNDFHNWNNWEPWSEIDTNIINNFPDNSCRKVGNSSVS